LLIPPRSTVARDPYAATIGASILREWESEMDERPSRPSKLRRTQTH
jgi:hypothetical protein